MMTYDTMAELCIMSRLMTEDADVLEAMRRIDEAAFFINNETNITKVKLIAYREAWIKWAMVLLEKRVDCESWEDVTTDEIVEYCKAFFDVVKDAFVEATHRIKEGEHK